MIHHKSFLLCAMLLAPCFAVAAEEVSATPEGKRFIPLDKARATQSGVHVVRPIPLRSDKAALASGALRSDTSPRPLRDTAPMIVTPTSRATAATDQNVNVIRSQPVVPSAAVDSSAGGAPADKGSATPVMGLYDDDEAPLLSFQDAMLGRAARSNMPPGKQGWPLPLMAEQKITSGFGMRSDPFTGKPAFHGGVDIAAPVGTSVLATAAGEAIQVATDKRYGRYISIRHDDGSVSRYGHLLAPAINLGDRVRAGQVIGAVGMSGRATGPHLDYRFVANGITIDPMRVLNPPVQLANTNR